MTKKLQFRATALACVLLLGMTTMAQGLQPTEACDVYCPSGKMNTHVNIMSYSSQKQMPKPAKADVAKAEGGMCTVTANLEYDPDLFGAPRFVGLYGFSLNGYMVQMGLYDNGEGVYQGQVEPGTYDIITCFNNGEGLMPYYVIYEQYEIKADVTLTFNPEFCTNCLTTKNYGPDGELLKHGLGHFDANGQFVLDEEGDIGATYVMTELWLKGIIGSLMNSKGGFSGPMLDEESRSIPFKIYVNDISDRFVFIQKRIAVTEDLSKSYWCYFSSDDVKTGLENDPNNYVQQTYNYKYTPYGSQQDGCGFESMFWSIDNDNNWQFSGIFFDSAGAKPSDVYNFEVWANIPYTDPNLPEWNILIQPVFNDYCAVDMYQNYYIPERWLGPALRVNDGQKMFANVGHHMAATNGITGGMVIPNALYNDIDEYGFEIMKLLPTPEAFTYPADQGLGILNNSCPINAVRVANFESFGRIYFAGITNFYVGRYGETRLCGNVDVTNTLMFNGEEVDLQTFMPEEKGICEYTAINTDIDVDGMSGKNTTTVYFDQNQADMTPPSIEMLHFKNNEGGVTDRFATADKGTMEFYASDFDYHYGINLYGLSVNTWNCQPVDVTVEYAPYGSEDWNELTVEEIPELYQEPGWGYFYRGSLAEVTGQGEQGWFDLKFRLVDASGNWQEQVISPAFRIDNLAYSSVATVGSGTAHEVARYNLAGQRVDASTSGVAIVKMSDGTARKVIVP